MEQDVFRSKLIASCVNLLPAPSTLRVSIDENKPAFPCCTCLLNRIIDGASGPVLSVHSSRPSFLFSFPPPPSQQNTLACPCPTS